MMGPGLPGSGDAARLRAGDRDAGLAVWLVDLQAGAAVLQALDAAHRLLPQAPRVAAPRLAGLSGPTVPAHERAARIALRALLAREVGIDAARQPFVVGPEGKPGLAAGGDTSGHGRGLEFSLAHCETAALVAISAVGPIGIDIELPRPVRISPDRRRMLEAAAAALAPAEPLPDSGDDHRFLQAWVRLEALAKATGEGISALLGRLGVRGRSLAEAAATPTGSRMHVRDLQLGRGEPPHAAIAGAMPSLAPGLPPPAVHRLPLDAASLAGLVANRG